MKGDRFLSTKFEDDVKSNKYNIRKKDRAKTKQKMRVSGAGVKNLRRIIADKCSGT